MRILYFARRVNDLDHATPVLWEFLEQNSGSVCIVVIGDRQLVDDPRIRFLATYAATEVLHFEDILQKRSRPDGMRTWRGLTRFYLRFRPRKRDLLVNDSAILFDRITRDDPEGTVALFDWCAGDSINQFYDAALQQCNLRGIVSVSIPHGDEPHHSYLNAVRHLDRNAPRWSPRYGEALAGFDFVIAPNERCAARFRPEIPDDRLKILGSARYSEKWMSEGLPRVQAVSSNRQLQAGTIVMFLRNSAYPIFWEEVERTIEMLSQLDGVSLVVQHHVTAESKQLIRKYPLLAPGQRGNVLVDGGQLSSAELVRRAAAVIDLGTSATFEAIRLRVPVLSPEYLHATRTTVSDLLPSSIVLGRDEMLSQLDTILANPQTTNYSDDDCRNFISQMLDIPDAHVLERHIAFLRHSVGEKHAALASVA